MTGTDLKHRLAAILAADAAGYSRLMAADERGTVAALDAARAGFRKQVESNQGRVVDTAGDSVLAVFDTAAGATLAALAIQDELVGGAQSVSPERRLLFRVGLHLGDVIEKTDGTIYGDGVNIAARLQTLAEAGGISVSESIRSAVRGKVSASFEDQGEQQVKNIAEPVRAYRAKTESIQASSAKQPVGDIDLSLPDKPSIAVLPFTNMSGDPEQEYFTDGITEDIITELSRFHSLFVIARNSSFTYKGKAVDVRQVSKELGVRYVLEGSIRRSANRVRVTAQLIDALSGKHIWAEKYDRVLEDIFAVQEEITQSIVGEIAPVVASAEIAKARRVRPRSLSAYEIATRALADVRDAHFNMDTALRDRGLQLAREALAIDHQSSTALHAIALANYLSIFYGIAPDRETAIREGIEAAKRALAVDPSDHSALAILGLLLFWGDRQGEGVATVRRACELNPNDVIALTCLTVLEAMSGSPERGIEIGLRALRVSPRDNVRHWVLTMLGWSAFFGKQYERGVAWAREAVSGTPRVPNGRLALVLNLVGAERLAEARAEFETLRDAAPEYVSSRIAGQWALSLEEYRRRATTFLRVAASLENPSAADALR